MIFLDFYYGELLNLDNVVLFKVGNIEARDGKKHLWVYAVSTAGVRVPIESVESDREGYTLLTRLSCALNEFEPDEEEAKLPIHVISWFSEVQQRTEEWSPESEP